MAQILPGPLFLGQRGMVSAAVRVRPGLPIWSLRRHHLREAPSSQALPSHAREALLNWTPLFVLFSLGLLSWLSPSSFLGPGPGRVGPSRSSDSLLPCSTAACTRPSLVRRGALTRVQCHVRKFLLHLPELFLSPCAHRHTHTHTHTHTPSSMQVRCNHACLQSFTVVSLVAQMIKKPPAMRETEFWSLGR